MYRVEWQQEAVNELADIWIKGDSPLRQAITSATHNLDRELAANPFRDSESRDGDVRILFTSPLGALFEVDVKRQVVWILHVWAFRQGQV